MMVRAFAILCFVLVAFQSLAQTSADWWYFGSYAGMHFESTGPVGVTDGQLSTYEGCASISDNNGNLLFYTDGDSVWNASHVAMPNGFDLLGNSSSTQSAIIIPVPNNSDQYYIVTVGVSPAIGLNYSVVDMSLAAGLGDVVSTQKNIFIRSGIREKAVAVKKGASNNYWLVTQVYNTDSLLAFEVGPTGINTTPQVSILSYETTNVSGYLKANINGNLLASGHESSALGIQLMEFDNVAGVVTNDIIFTTGQSCYAVEFSPNSEFLYTAPRSGSGTLYQYNISSFDSVLIEASQELIASGTGTGALQLGPNLKIYMARTGGVTNGYLACIQEPNNQGVNCNFLDSAVYLEGRTSTQGLPPFIASLVAANFDANNACLGDSIFFSSDSTAYDSVFWNFGDPGSGVNNTSTLFNPSHFYGDTGEYSVTLIAQIDTVYDTTSNTVYIYPRQTLDLGPDTSLCNPEVLRLDVKEQFSTYLWSDSTTADSFIVDKDATIWVTLFGVCDTLNDTITVRFNDSVFIDIGSDTSFCEGNTLVVDADINVETDLEWNTGLQNSDSILIDKTGMYRLTASNACGVFEDSIFVTVIPIPPADSGLLPPDTVNCFDSQIVLERPVNDSITYLWSDSSSVKRYEVDTTETVWLIAFNECGFSSDTMEIVFNGEIKTELGEDTVICDEDSIQIYGTDSLAIYTWNTGDTTDTIWTIPGVDENYIVTIKLGQCEKVESKRVLSNVLYCPPIDCSLEYGNVFTPNGDGVNDRFTISSDCDIFRFDMYIYNRWGQLVNYSQNVSFGWDGYVNGELAAEGTYYFIVEYKDFVVVDADRRRTQGSFELIR
ncbi:MAG: gliding motility-associated C-terminal domain-containing protein [Salibacteraceae bacterium]